MRLISSSYCPIDDGKERTGIYGWLVRPLIDFPFRPVVRSFACIRWCPKMGEHPSGWGYICISKSRPTGMTPTTTFSGWEGHSHRYRGRLTFSQSRARAAQIRQHKWRVSFYLTVHAYKPSLFSPSFFAGSIFATSRAFTRPSCLYRNENLCTAC